MEIITRNRSMAKWILALLATTTAWSSSWAEAIVVKKVFKADAEVFGNLLSNHGLEEGEQSPLPAWQPWEVGYEVDVQVFHAGKQSARCINTGIEQHRGLGQTVALNQDKPLPLVAECFSKAENVSGTPDSNYSLYLDLEFVDGTPLWGQTGNFSCGTHDWEKRRVVIVPQKPIKHVTVFGIFRGHTGTAWFDDFTLTEWKLSEGVALFDGVPVGRVKPSAKRGGRSLTLKSPDGMILKLGSSTGEVLGKANQRGGFFLRDVSAQSDFRQPLGEVRAKGGATVWQAVDDELKLRLSATYHLGRVESGKEGKAGFIRVDGVVADLSQRDRAVTVYFALPLDAVGWRWSEDLRKELTIQAGKSHFRGVTVGAGVTGQMSLYPLACVSSDKTGWAIATPLDVPRLYRLGYDAGSRELYVAFDFGLSPETTKFPSKATFSFLLYNFHPQWGGRAALKKYYDIFPGFFAKRLKKEGLWMAFTDIATVKGFEDFGFAFQEGAPNAAFDGKHGIYSFVYVEPMSHWLAMPPEAPRTPEGALEVLNKDLTGVRGSVAKDMAAATLTSGICGPDGKYALSLHKAPWCDGALFLLSPDPDIPATDERPVNKANVMFRGIESAFEKNLPRNPGLKGVSGKSELDGTYLDSLEMGASELNYRREHFQHADIPLVFDRHECRPCQLMIFSTYEFEKEIAERMHQQDKLMFANAVLWRFAFPAHLLDVLGTEVNWLRGEKYQPDTDAVMTFRRAMCYRKPYCLLMNTNYEKFTHELVERYMKRCLFYTVFPGFFDEEAALKDPYWTSPKKWYDRDRDLFKVYLPLTVLLAQAGWEPLTLARTDNEKVYVERYGSFDAGSLHFTLFNESDQVQQFRLTVELRGLDIRRKPRITDVLAARELPVQVKGKTAVVSGELPPEEVLVLRTDKR